MPTHGDVRGTKPRLLFISPTFPASGGNGLAMRAGMWVEALARRYRVALLVVPLFVTTSPGAEAFARTRCESVTVVAPSRSRRLRLGPPWDRRPGLLRDFAAQSDACVEATAALDRPVDVIHAFRLYTAPVALDVARRMPGARLHLDVDDIESLTRARFADLQRARGRIETARRHEDDARRFAAAERDLIPRFDRVYACSALDAARLRDLVPQAPDVCVVPNAVRIPRPAPEPRTTHPFTLLFIGTLDYEPNRDAVRWFTRRVLPRIHARAGRRVLVRVAGRLPPDSLSAVAGLRGVRLAGEVADITAEYADADAAIVPLRAGGGTRIKVLEAFAHRRPVVSTSIGVEGIDAESGRHLLVADDPESFAVACLRLMDEPALAASLVRNAENLAATRYSQDVADRLISEST